MTLPLDEAIRLSVDYITNRAQHFFSVVRSKQEDGVLWFAFAYKEEAIQSAIRTQRYLSADEASKSGVLVVKKTAFLPISAIITTDSKPLLEMTNRCDVRQQFVAWFTLETLVPAGFSADASGLNSGLKPSGTPQVSKVIIVDTLYQQQNSAYIQQQIAASSRNMPSRFATPGRAGFSNNQNNNNQQQPSSSAVAGRTSQSIIEDLKNDMQSTASQLQSQQRENAAGPSRTLGGGRFHSSNQSLFGADRATHYSTSPQRGPGQQQQQNGYYNNNFNNSYSNNSPPGNANNNNNNNSSSMAITSDANYSHLLKVSLQISDSVAKLSNKLDDLSSQYFTFEKNVQAQMLEMKGKIAKLELSANEVRPKIQEVSDSTLHFGTKLAHMRQETQAMFEGVSRRVQTLSESIIVNNLRTVTNSNSGMNNNNNSSSANFAPSPSLAVQQQNQNYNNNNNLQQQSSGNNYSFANYNNNNGGVGRSASSTALQAVEDADKIVDFDDLVAKHSFAGHSKNNFEQNNNRREGGGGGGKESPSHSAIDSFLSENYDRQPNFASRKADLESRSHAMNRASEVVDEYQTVARDVINYESQNQSDDRHHPISLTGVHRQKASLELARQTAADRSEAQAIASNYMNERNKALLKDTYEEDDRSQNMRMNDNTYRNFDDRRREQESSRGGGLAVPLENAGGSTGGASFMVSDDATMFTARQQAGTKPKQTESLADMIASMEKRLQ